MAPGDRTPRKIIPFPGRRVDEKPAFPLRLAAIVIAALLAGQTLQVLQTAGRVEPVAMPDAIDMPVLPAIPGR
ncbi:hypothetical protein D3C72_671750 [compost metagenome]